MKTPIFQAKVFMRQAVLPSYQTLFGANPKKANTPFEGNLAYSKY